MGEKSCLGQTNRTLVWVKFMEDEERLENGSRMKEAEETGQLNDVCGLGSSCESVLIS